MSHKPIIHDGQSGNIFIAKNEGERIREEAILKDETLWMPQAMMAQLFDVQP